MNAPSSGRDRAPVRAFAATMMLTVLLGPAVRGSDPSCGNGLFPLEIQRSPQPATPRALVLDEIDGHPGLDLLYLGRSDPSNVTLHTGIVDGRIGGATVVEVEGVAITGAIVDLDGDSDLDVVAVTGGPDLVQVLENTGAGVFVHASAQAIPPDYDDMAVLDVNGDGLPDVVLVGRFVTSASLCVLEGIAPLELGSATIVPTEWEVPRWVTGGDLDADGRDEIIVGAHPFLAAYEWNHGDLSALFANEVEAVGELSTVGLIAGGPPEVLVVRTDLATYRITDEGFELIQRLDLDPAGHEPRFADWTGDGVPELLVPSGEQVQIFDDLGGGKFELIERHVVGNAITTVAAGDLDLDSDIDLLAYDQDGRLNGFTVSLREDDGSLPLPTRMRPPDGLARHVNGADIDGDGATDIVVTTEYPAGFDTYLQRPGPRFEYAGTVPVSASQVLDTRVADIDGDGDPDMLATTHLVHGLRVARTIDGELTLTDIYSASDVRRFDLGDLDGDGDPDVAMAIWNIDRVQVRLNDGAGSFSESRMIDVFHAPVGVAIADVNGDGLADLATSNGDDHQVSLFTNLGEASFAPPVDFPVGFPGGYSLQDIEAADLNADGYDDVVVTLYHFGPSVITVLLADGRGGFLPPTSYECAWGAHSLAIDDVSGDGILDVVVGHLVEEAFLVFPGTGSGDLEPPQRYPLGRETIGISTADVTLDGNPDILSARVHFSVFPSLLCHVADLDGDGAVGQVDLQILIDSWGPCEASPCPADFDGDGSVGFSDLLRLLESWTEGPVDRGARPGLTRPAARLDLGRIGAIGAVG